jgi:hypothetical protein
MPPTKRRKPTISVFQKKTSYRRKRSKKPTQVKKPLSHKKKQLTHKLRPQITVVYGKLYSNTCGHCITLQPIWDNLVVYFENHRNKFPNSHVVYKEVAIENKQLGPGIAEANNTYLFNSPNKIESPMVFPTIFRIYDGKLEYFNGNRDYNTLVRWFSRGNPTNV